MLLLFWRNPEFVRHQRSELRRSRALAVLLVVVVLCVLMGLGCWAERANEMARERQSNMENGQPTAVELQGLEQRNPTEFWRLFYRTLIYGQIIALTFWTLFSCAQGISGERERKTWDFQRTTRLRPSELLIGKLLGGPVLAYFMVLCSLPIAVFAGVRGGIGPLAIFYVYVLMIASALFVGVAGLWMSNMFESQSRGVGILGALGLLGLMIGAAGFERSAFPGFAGLSPLTALNPLTEGFTRADGADTAAIFGKPVPWTFMSLLLYITFGAWFVLMLVRNLKKDHEDLRLLSRWQVVGCAAFLNFIVYAFYNPEPWKQLSPTQFATMMVGLNGLILLAMGLATLTPRERLKLWWQRWHAKQAGVFAEDGLPWPWLAISAAVAYGLLAWGLSAWKNALGFEIGAFQSGLVQLLAVLIFITRDVLFIQWCTLTRMRAPLVKGVLYLGLYYIASGTLASVFAIQSLAAMQRFVNIATPAGIFTEGVSGFHFPISVFVGMAIQLAAIMALLAVIARRLSRPATVPAMAAD